MIHSSPKLTEVLLTRIHQLDYSGGPIVVPLSILIHRYRAAAQQRPKTTGFASRPAAGGLRHFFFGGNINATHGDSSTQNPQERSTTFCSYHRNAHSSHHGLH